MDETLDLAREQLALELFLEARDLSVADREEFLNRRCAGDPALLLRVNALMSADCMAGDVLDAAKNALRSLVQMRKASLSSSPEGTDGAIGVDQTGLKGLVEGYEILGSLGEGGMGKVYLAFAGTLKRHVALKVVKVSDAKWCERFLREAEIMANLHHPGIVPVFDCGLTGSGLPYYTMPVLRGLTLKEVLENRCKGDLETLKAFPQRRLLRIFRDIVDAVAYAHSQGVLHRDLKPGNAMFGEHGEIQVLDWGLAKVMTSPHASQAAADGPDEPISSRAAERPTRMAGTFPYISPEQLRNVSQKVSTASDIYSLGVMLYEIISGEPFAGQTDGADAVLEAAEGRVRWPAARFPNRRIPRELDAVVQRAMAFQPEDRYANAKDLAREITAHLEGRLLAAARYGPFAPFRKWITRNRVLSSVIGASVIILLAFACIFVVNLNRQYKRAVAAELRETAERIQAEDSLAYSRYLTAELLARAGRLWEAGEQLDDVERTDVRHAVSPLALVVERWMLARAGLSIELLTLSDHAGPMNCVAFTPDGRQVVSGGLDGTIRVWDVRTGSQVASLSLGRDEIRDLAIAPIGGFAAAVTSGSEACGFSYEEQSVLWRHAVQSRFLTGIALSKDGKRAFASGADGTIEVLNTRDGSLQQVLSGGPRNSDRLAVSPDGRLLACGFGGRFQNGGGYALWDWSRGALLGLHRGHDDAVRFVAFAPIQQLLATGSEDTTLKLWKVPSGELVRVFTGHDRGIKGGAFSNTGMYLLSSSFDRTLRVWNVETGETIQRLTGHTAQVDSVSVSPNGRVAVTASHDGSLKTWSVLGDALVRRFAPERGVVTAVATSPDGRLCLTGHVTGEASLLDLETGKELARLAGREYLTTVALAEDVRLAAVATHKGLLTVWDLTAQKALWARAAHTVTIPAADFSDDSKELWSAGQDGKIVRWRAGDGAVLETRDPAFRVRTLLSVSADWQYALGSTDTGLALWSTQSGNAIWDVAVDQSDFSCAAFLPDGKGILLGATLSGRIITLDATTGRRLAEIERPGASIVNIVPSSDGRHAVACTGLGPTLLDLQVGREIHTFPTDDTTYEGPSAFAGDTLTIVQAGKTLQLWKLEFPARLEEARARLPRALKRLRVSPDDGEGLCAYGEYYALRGLNDWALDFFARSEAAGFPVPHESFARVLWKLGQPSKAAEQYEKGCNSALEKDSAYLELCRAAARKEAADGDVGSDSAHAPGIGSSQRDRGSLSP